MQRVEGRVQDYAWGKKGLASAVATLSYAGGSLASVDPNTPYAEVRRRRRRRRVRRTEKKKNGEERSEEEEKDTNHPSFGADSSGWGRTPRLQRL